MNRGCSTRSLPPCHCIISATRQTSISCFQSSSRRVAGRANAWNALCCSVPPQGQPDEAVPVWRNRIVKAVRVLVGVIAVFVACDILNFLGSRPPTDGDAWRSLTSREDDSSLPSAAKRTQPIVIYDRHKRVIAQFSSNFIPLNQVNTPGNQNAICRVCNTTTHRDVQSFINSSCLMNVESETNLLQKSVVVFSCMLAGA